MRSYEALNAARVDVMCRLVYAFESRVCESGTRGVIMTLSENAALRRHEDENA